MEQNPFFDRKADLTVRTGGNLPHWNQSGKIQYVTFRLADSLPLSHRTDLKEAVDQFRQTHPEPWDYQTSILFRKTIGKMEQRLLDNGYGECCLRQQNVRHILMQTIEFGNHSRYEVIALVIMPNHVHMLLLTTDGTDISKILQSIKRHSAREINKLLNRSGRLWMSESFDRVIRNIDHLDYCVKYIRNNPRNLPDDAFHLHINHPLLNRFR